ncbi:sulfotransferase [Microbulbifer pacificus]|uniref:sulfotransferase n=1 Tax=Microbulbifer pacificus TaxID=407164 RepID=UPI000CF49922|nr:sulfotransferase [Microbulbifer pacificus]
MNPKLEHQKNSYQLAADLFRAKKYDAALECLAVANDDRRLSVAEEVKVSRLRADILVAKGELSSAVQAIDIAFNAIQPDDSIYLPIAMHRAAIHLRAGDIAGAAEIDGELFLRCNDIQLLAQAGYIFTLCERHEEALKLYKAALLLQPDDPQLLFNAATSCRAMGYFTEAESLYDQVVARNPADWEAYKNRSDLRKQTTESNHISQLKKLVSIDMLPPQARVQLNFALAKELEDLNRFDESFEYLEKGCAARRSGLHYDVEKDLATIDAIIGIFSKRYFDRTPRTEETSQRIGDGLIFVLGMPRTGTTLVDRMLTSAPGVMSVGEPDTFARFLTEAVSRSHQSGFDSKSTFVRASSEVDFHQLGLRYQGQMAARARNIQAEIVVDKNPMNFLYAGLIHKALPGAKIVHLCRNPMDTCYAIYKTLFKTAYPFSYSQREMARYYLAYRQLMRHWHDVLPGSIFDLEYEALVENPEEEAQRLFAFCNLPWESSVLEFYRRTDRGTATASAVQVRQPVYRSSIEKWKNFKMQLEPMSEIFRNAGISC